MVATTRSRQAVKIEEWLRILHPLPGEVVELRALDVEGRKAVCECYADPAALADRAVELDQAGARGCYATLNPLRPELAGHKGANGAKKADVIHRHWLPLDVDPVRAAGTNSTDEERAAAWQVIDRARGLLESSGLVGAVVGDSGNGWHLCYPIDLPNDDVSQALVKAVLAGVARRCDSMGISLVDPKVFDAPRIWKLYGTRTRKGPDTGDRPQRWAQLVEGRPWDEAQAGQNSRVLIGLPKLWQQMEDMRKGRPGGAEGLTPAERARLYVAKMPPAIAGQNGHGATFEVAQVLVRGFGLPDAEAWPILADYSARCQPPWSEGELKHKLTDARYKSGLPAGYLLGESPGPQANGVHDGPMVAPAKAAGEPQPWEETVPIDEGLPAEPFPLDVLPEGLRRFVEESAWAINCPVDFVAVPVLVAAGAAIGNTYRLAITRTHTQGAVLFACVVGLASSGKSPALELVVDPFERAQWRYLQDFKHRQKAWKNEGCQGEPPQLRQLVVDDATVEAVAPLLQSNPRGLLMVRDEMAALVTGLNQYKDGGKGSDRQFVLKLWPQATIRVHRVKHEGGMPLTVHRPFLGLVGGIQPSVVDSLRQRAEQGQEVVEDGFLDRFLFSYPAPMPAIGEQWREVSQEASDVWETVVGRLLELPMAVESERIRSVLVPLSSSGRAAWKEFTDAHAAELNDPDFPPHLVGPWGKFRGYAGRLALILHLIREATGEVAEKAVDGESMTRAARLVAYFKSHFRRTHQALGADPRTVDARVVLTWVMRNGQPRFTRRDLWRGLRCRFARPESLDAPLKLLTHLGYVRQVEVPILKTGRPSQVWEVHPAPGDR